MLQAAHLGLAGIGLCDRNSVAGVVRAHVLKREKELSLAYHPGARLVFCDGTPDILAYPRDRPAWGRLCRLLTRGNLRAEKGECILRLDDLLEHVDGLELIVMERSTWDLPSPPVLRSKPKPPAHSHEPLSDAAMAPLTLPGQPTPNSTPAMDFPMLPRPCLQTMFRPHAINRHPFVPAQAGTHLSCEETLGSRLRGNERKMAFITAKEVQGPNSTWSSPKAANAAIRMPVSSLGCVTPRPGGCGSPPSCSIAATTARGLPAARRSPGRSACR